MKCHPCIVMQTMTQGHARGCDRMEREPEKCSGREREEEKKIEKKKTAIEKESINFLSKINDPQRDLT